MKFKQLVIAGLAAIAIATCAQTPSSAEAHHSNAWWAQHRAEIAREQHQYGGGVVHHSNAWWAQRRADIRRQQAFWHNRRSQISADNRFWARRNASIAAAKARYAHRAPARDRDYDADDRRRTNPGLHRGWDKQNRNHH